MRPKPKISVALTQPVLLNGKLIDLKLFPATLNKARIGYDREEATRRGARNQAVYQAVQLYCSAVEQRRAVAYLGRAVALAERRLSALEQNLRLGAVTEADVLDSRIGVGQQRQALLDARAGLSRTERALANATGLETLAGVELSDSVPAYVLEGDGTALAEQALREHPQIRSLSLTAQERRLDEVLAGQRYASTLTLGFSVAPRYPFSASTTSRSITESMTDLFAEGSGQDWSATAGLTLRLFDGGKQREDRAASRALSVAAEQGLSSQRMAVLDDLEAFGQRRSLLEDRLSLLAEAVELARRRLANQESLLGLGRSTEVEVDARRLDLEARENDRLQAQVDLLLTNMSLASLVGRDISTIVEGLGK